MLDTNESSNNECLRCLNKRLNYLEIKLYYRCVKDYYYSLDKHISGCNQQRPKGLLERYIVKLYTFDDEERIILKPDYTNIIIISVLQLLLLINRFRIEGRSSLPEYTTLLLSNCARSSLCFLLVTKIKILFLILLSSRLIDQSVLRTSLFQSLFPPKIYPLVAATLDNTIKVSDSKLCIKQLQERPRELVVINTKLALY